MKSLQTKLITFCDYASVSRENKLSVMSIFDEVLEHNKAKVVSTSINVIHVKQNQEVKYKLLN